MFAIGRTVVLDNKKSVYITGFNEETHQYEGFDVEDPAEKVTFFESSVILTV